MLLCAEVCEDTKTFSSFPGNLTTQYRVYIVSGDDKVATNGRQVTTVQETVADWLELLSYQ
jgi:hypothetical protein